MGILSEIKKLVFGIESVSKSAINETKKSIEDAADKASDEIVRKTSGLKDAIVDKSESAFDSIKSSEAIKKAQDKMDDISEQIQESASEWSNKAEDTFDNIKSSDALKKAKGSLDDLSEKIQNTASDVAEKAADVSEKIGETVFGENNERLDKAKEMTEDIGKKVLETKDKIVEKARDLKEDIEETIDDTIEKAKEVEAKEKMEMKKRSETPPTDHGSSLLDEKDDFFSKAEKYAEGDYAAFSEGKISLDPKIRTKKKLDERTAAGFEDLDGDGNEIVDDAIIDESDSPT